MLIEGLSMPCPACGCDAITGARAHAIQAALCVDDLDAAIERGLLDAGNDCDACSEPCRESLRLALATRQRAFAARERFRGRESRLARRQQERDARRNATTASSNAGAATAGLPPAAAAALARAKAKAAGRDGQ